MQTISINSSDELLAGLLINPPTPPRLIVISGESSCGKTAWCTNLVESARRGGLQAAGLLSPAVYFKGSKTSIDLQDIRTGCRLRLAERLGSFPRGVPVGEWDMNPAILEWGNEQLLAAPECPLLVVDELGPLEFKEHSGLTAAFNLVEAKRHTLTCIVVRPELLTMAASRWPWAEILELPIHKKVA